MCVCMRPIERLKQREKERGSESVRSVEFEEKAYTPSLPTQTDTERTERNPCVLTISSLLLHGRAVYTACEHREREEERESVA